MTKKIKKSECSKNIQNGHHVQCFDMFTVWYFGVKFHLPHAWLYYVYVDDLGVSLKVPTVGRTKLTN